MNEVSVFDPAQSSMTKPSGQWSSKFTSWLYERQHAELKWISKSIYSMRNLMPRFGKQKYTTYICSTSWVSYTGNRNWDV